MSNTNEVNHLSEESLPIAVVKENETAICEYELSDASSKRTDLSEVKMGIHSASAFDFMNRIAVAFSSSSLVPAIYQGRGGIANCLIALNMATRMGVDPLMVMQNLYIVQNKPGFSSQFLIATFNSTGKFSTINYEFSGQEGEDSWGCAASCVNKETGESLKGAKVTMKLAREEGWSTRPGSKWKTMPQQMLMYRSAAFLIRAYAPEISLGIHTVEELYDIKKSEDTHKPTVLKTVNH